MGFTDDTLNEASAYRNSARTLQQAVQSADKNGAANVAVYKLRRKDIQDISVPHAREIQLTNFGFNVAVALFDANGVATGAWLWDYDTNVAGVITPTLNARAEVRRANKKCKYAAWPLLKLYRDFPVGSVVEYKGLRFKVYLPNYALASQIISELGTFVYSDNDSIFEASNLYKKLREWLGPNDGGNGGQPQKSLQCNYQPGF